VTRWNDIYLNAGSNSGQTVPLFLETRSLVDTLRLLPAPVVHDQFEEVVIGFGILFITGSSIESFLERRAVSQNHADGHVFTNADAFKRRPSYAKRKMPAPTQVTGQCHGPTDKVQCVKKVHHV